MISLVRTHHKPAVKEPVALKTLLGGFHFVFNQRIILGMISLDLFAVLFGGADMLLPIYAKDILQVGPQGLGWLRAALPAGSLVCALILAHRPLFTKAGRALVGAVVVFGLGPSALASRAGSGSRCSCCSSVAWRTRSASSSATLRCSCSRRTRCGAGSPLSIIYSSALPMNWAGPNPVFSAPGKGRCFPWSSVGWGGAGRGGGGLLAFSGNPALRQAGAAVPAAVAGGGWSGSGEIAVGGRF